MDVITNIKVLTPNRKKVRPGDIFVLQIRNDEYIFGRVVRTDGTVGGGWNQAILIYIYNAIADDKNNIPDLDKSNLLVPPILTNKVPWLRGYFETVAHRPLVDEEVFHPHCFYSYSSCRYFDEYGQELPYRVEPCGERGLHSFRTIDDAVSKALGIAPAPDQQVSVCLLRSVFSVASDRMATLSIPIAGKRKRNQFETRKP